MNYGVMNSLHGMNYHISIVNIVSTGHYCKYIIGFFLIHVQSRFGFLNLNSDFPNKFDNKL